MSYICAHFTDEESEAQGEVTCPRSQSGRWKRSHTRAGTGRGDNAAFPLRPNRKPEAHTLPRPPPRGMSVPPSDSPPHGPAFLSFRCGSGIRPPGPSLNVTQPASPSQPLKRPSAVPPCPCSLQHFLVPDASHCRSPPSSHQEGGVVRGSQLPQACRCCSRSTCHVGSEEQGASFRVRLFRVRL